RLRRLAFEALRVDAPPVKTPVDRLSNREIEVLRHLGTGLTSAEIATGLRLSTSTVDTYRERIKAKLNLASAAELTHYATRWLLGQD
ncbi:MAG: response regulator transcription factor, partial [Gammaproteobacteria bacterium]